MIVDVYKTQLSSLLKFLQVTTNDSYAVMARKLNVDVGSLLLFMKGLAVPTAGFYDKLLRGYKMSPEDVKLVHSLQRDLKDA